MFKKHNQFHRRSSFLPYVIFRTFLSLIIFIILIAGLYSAYRQFSGFDPISMNPRALIANFLAPGTDLQQLKKMVMVKINQTEQPEVQGEEEEYQYEIPKPNTSQPQKVEQTGSTTKIAKFSFMLVADSHNENNILKKALQQAKDQNSNLKFVIGLGDYTEVGTTDELIKAKTQFDINSIRYFVTAGDHDLWDARDKQNISEDADEDIKHGAALTNFTSVFGRPYQSFSYEKVKFLLLFNSDNYVGLGSEQRRWLVEELDMTKAKNEDKLIFVLLHEPLYHPSSTRVMGKVNDDVKNEAKSLIQLFKDNGVNEVFAGDIHYFTRYSDPQTGLLMTTIGAAATQRNTQNPRYTIVTVYNDNSYDVSDVEIK